jgi:hypothetical protein
MSSLRGTYGYAAPEIYPEIAEVLGYGPEHGHVYANAVDM